MEHGGNQSLQGAGNLGIQNISHGSTVNVYGFAPNPVQAQDAFGESLKIRYPLKQKRLPEKYLVNCNRSEELEQLLEQNKSYSQHQHYFILACPNQHPVSLVQRFVFELLEEPVASRDGVTIQYPRIQDYPGARCISVQPLDHRLQIEKLQRYWLEQLQKQDHDFFGFVQQELPEQPHDYIVSAFECPIIHLQKNQFELLMSSWMNAFQQKASSGPKCVFFFIIYVHNFYPEARLKPQEFEILDYVRCLKQGNSERICLIDSLPKVKLEDLEYWIGEILGGYKPLCFFREWAKQEYNMEIDEDPDTMIDMALIHSFQQRIWQYRQIPV